MAKQKINTKTTHKYKAINKEGFRSTLEKFAFNRLKEESISFCYECEKIELLPSFSRPFPCFERAGNKGLKKSLFSDKNGRTRATRPTTYTPDFLWRDPSDASRAWYMETKGMRTPDFDLKWKMFQYRLFITREDALLLLPRNKEEVEKAISIIQLWVNREDLESQQGIVDQLPAPKFRTPGVRVKSVKKAIANL